MRRILLLLACLLGSAVGGVIGLVVGVALNSTLLAWASAAAFPVLALVLAGVRQWGLLVKVAGYALLGWGLCFVLQPLVEQDAMSRARRLASDPMAGKGWYIACYLASWILVSVGVAFLPSRHGTNTSTPATGRE